jgi:hypothetical protein
MKQEIIVSIFKQFKNRFRVFDNTGDSKRVVAGQFPDVILMRLEPPPNNDIFFVMKIETPESILVDDLPEWKELNA